jgi:hypothetical protein
MGRSIIEIVEADFQEHGPEVISELRNKNPAAYARLISDLVHFKGLLNSERIAPKRKPRPLRMKELLKEMEDRPIDVNSPILPPKHRDRWLAALEALRPRMPWDLTPDELREAWGDDLAAWWEKQLRHTRGPMAFRRRMVAVRYHMKVRPSPKEA